MAFPALGLAKIVWAVDVILAMDLPEFRAAGLVAQPPESTKPTATAWHDVMAVTDLAPGATTRVICDGRGLFVHHSVRPGAHPDDSGWAVFDSLCPHQTTNIPHLALNGYTLTCPKHEWEFDVRSGECIAKGNQPLKRWEHKVEGGRLFARW